MFYASNGGTLQLLKKKFTDLQFNVLFSSLFKVSNKEIQQYEISEYLLRHCISRRTI